MILARLKQETRPQHDAVEARLHLLDRPPTPDEYRGLLRRFLGFYAPVEARLAAAADWPALGLDFDRRRKTGSLERDLADLGDTPEVLESLPRCGELPELATAPRALGCMYVLEGATLGGQVIRRHLRASPGGPLPCAFFGSYGDAIGPMWKSFGEFLTRYAAAANGAADDEIVGSARATFSALDAWLAGGEGRP